MALLTLYDPSRLTPSQLQNLNLIQKIRATSTKTMAFFYILISILFTIVVWQFDELEALVYPFTLLSTFFHEISHGIMAMLCFGWNAFEKLHISPDASGEAIYMIIKNGKEENPDFWQKLLFFQSFSEKHKEALIAVSGLIGPSIFGSFLVIPSAFFPNAKEFRIIGKKLVFSIPRNILFLLGLFMLVCCFLWIEGIFAIIFIVLISLLFEYVVFKCRPEASVFWVLFTGVQALISFFHGFEYIFVKYVEDLDINETQNSKKNPLLNLLKPEKKKTLSDTGVIAESLGLGHEFVGCVVFLIDCSLLFLCLFFAYRMHYKQNIEKEKQEFTPRPILPT